MGLMETFKVFINFKTYPQGTGEKAEALVREIEKVRNGEMEKLRNGEIEIIPIVQAVDLFRIRQETKLPVWVQHIDWQGSGKFTGWTNLEAIMEAGGVGTLLNHSEHPIAPGTIHNMLARVAKLKIQSQVPDGTWQSEKFKVMVCAKTLGQVERLVKLKPDYIGYEIAELIGTKTSITATNPKAIEHAVKICKDIPLIVGAGVNSAEDLVIAKKLGAKGVLISSAVVLSEKPGEKLSELIKLIS